MKKLNRIFAFLLALALLVTSFAGTFAVEAAAEEVTTRVHFYNSRGWAAVNAYVYGASNGEALGGWPGAAATRDGETDWWYVDVPAKPQFTIIFNDGGSNQTANVNIIENTYVAMDGAAYATKSEAEEAVKEPEIPETLTIWFYNSDNWATVNAYVFGATNGEALGAWPGTAATRDGETNWWSVEVPAGPQFTIIFNNGAGSQSRDVSIADGTNIYVTVDSATPFETKEAAEKSIENAEPKSTVVWFYNSDNWATVNAYVYGASNGDVLGGWPGTAATRDGETNWWSVEVPAEPQFTIIFNDGGSNQTANVNIIENTYVAMDGAAYATKSEAEEAANKPEVPETRTIWFYNNQNWEAVAAHIYNDNGNLFGDWPGKLLTADSGNWYSLEVDAATLSQYHTIIFNNNNNGAQLAGVGVPTKDAPCFADGKWYATKAEAEEAVKEPEVPETLTIWFYNNQNWEAVAAHIYNDNGNLFGDWPGKLLTADSGNWYSLEVDAATLSQYHTIIFNNNNNGAQLAGVGVPTKDAPCFADGKWYATKAEAEEAVKEPEVPETLTIWFYNNQNWEAVAAHIYNDNGNLFGDWPGKLLTADSGNWYSLEVDAATLSQYHTVIFNNNNNGAQLAGVGVPTKDAPCFADGKWYATKAEAEKAANKPEVPETLTIWFYNSDNWATVNAYVFGATNGEALGTWPGTAATRDGETGWWYVDVPAKPQFTIIFNDGGSNQTANVNIIENTYVAMDGTAYATKAEAEEAVKEPEIPETLTVWFYNSDNWATVNAYVFGATNGEALGAWPGTAATRDGETGWWYVDVPAKPQFTIIFNDGGSNQTANVNIIENTYVAMDGTAYATKAEAEEAVKEPEVPETLTVWFYNSDNWETVNAYVYGATNGEALGAWPGTAATRDGETNWWSVEVPAGPQFTIIFNNGAGSQSRDVSIADGTNIYATVDSVTPFETKEAAEQSVENAEPKSTVVWFCNSGNWAAVNAYVFGATNGEALGAWPGAAATRDGETNWWYVEVPANPQFTIIFNNGSGAQIKDTSIADKSNTYITAKGIAYASKEDAEKALSGSETPDDPGDSTTVWFYNSDNWTTVNAYVYGATNGEALGDWPGAAATRDGETNWWSVEVPAGPQFTIIFNNGEGSQSRDVSIADRTNIYVTVDSATPFETKEAAENSVESAEPKSTVVWFYNSDNWAAVNAYVFGASNGEALGTWPGTAATRDGETNWWFVEVPANPEFTIIFNNGAGSQSKDVPIADRTNIYVTVDSATPFETKEAAEKSIENAEPKSTVVWFYNSDNWATVNAYVFGATNGEAMGTWPGTAATRDGETNWWSVEVPANPKFVIIFNNGSGAQTMDVTIADKEQVYVTVTGSDAYADKKAAETAQGTMDEERKGTVRVWFYNSEGWARVNAYIYGSVQTEPLGAWPGTRATRDSERWWYMDIDVDRPFYVIFNNGSNSQSPDTQLTDSTNVYVTMNQDGAYASKQEAEDSITKLKPILSATTTVWFYNNVGWKNVCAYAWGTANADPLGKWPGSAAQRYEDTDWWYFTCNFPAPFHIIFNDGIEGGAQTQGVHITDSWTVYTTYQANKKYASKEAAEAAVGGTVKVYFYNSNGWSEVYAYGWGGVQGENFGAWPGTLATREDQDSYWYYVEILAGSQLNLIFNNGVDEQTNGVLIDDNENLYVTVNDEKFANKADAEATIEHVEEIPPARVNEPHTVWYYNTENWDQVYLYVENADGKAFFDSEPGVKMHRLGNTGWFYMNVAAEFDFTVLFSDGIANKSREFTVSDKTGTYFTFDGQYTSKSEVEALFTEPTQAPVQEDAPVKEDPVKEDGNSLAGIVAGGCVTSALAIGAYAWILRKKRKK